MPDLWERALVRDVAQLAEHLNVMAHAHILPQEVVQGRLRIGGEGQGYTKWKGENE